jgi:hypothetical protein
LKQAIVQKPKSSAITEGVCFLKPKATEVALLRTLPPPDDIDPEGGESSVALTIVDDSDDEDDELPPPPPGLARQMSYTNETTLEQVAVEEDTKVETGATTVEPVSVSAVEELKEPVVAAEEPKKKRVITKKKA